MALSIFWIMCQGKREPTRYERSQAERDYRLFIFRFSRGQDKPLFVVIATRFQLRRLGRMSAISSTCFQTLVGSRCTPVAEAYRFTALSIFIVPRQSRRAGSLLPPCASARPVSGPRPQSLFSCSPKMTILIGTCAVRSDPIGSPARHIGSARHAPGSIPDP